MALGSSRSTRPSLGQSIGGRWPGDVSPLRAPKRRRWSRAICRCRKTVAGDKTIFQARFFASGRHTRESSALREKKVRIELLKWHTALNHPAQRYSPRQLGQRPGCRHGRPDRYGPVGIRDRDASAASAGSGDRDARELQASRRLREEPLPPKTELLSEWCWKRPTPELQRRSHPCVRSDHTSLSN
jgi:hypothetical protein